MMRTALDQTTILYQVIKASPLPSLINGKVYKHQRPLNSSVRDIVVNAITIEGSESVIQRGIANVNFHAPNLDNGQPDDLFFETVGSVGKTILASFQGQSYNFWTEVAGVMVRDESTGEWYLNFRLKFKFHNTF